MGISCNKIEDTNKLIPGSGISLENGSIHPILRWRLDGRFSEKKLGKYMSCFTIQKSV